MPEVEVVRRGLLEHVPGKRIEAIACLHPRTVRRQAGGAAEFVALLAGRTLAGADRRGKFLWLTTDDPGLALAAHLGMSGQFRVDRPGASVHVHARVLADLGDRTLTFVDQRTFGWLAAADVVLDSHGRWVPRMVAGIALDPADPEFDEVAAARGMRTHRVEVKRLLLDQSLVSGIGNIYADEALWRAGVHPRRRADRMTVGALRTVLRSAAEVMALALSQGGTTFDGLYVNVNGSSGYFSRGLAVYGRAGLPCPRCGAPIVRERFMNRSSHACPRCQPPPRG